jgi:hypothetical protein
MCCCNSDRCNGNRPFLLSCWTGLPEKKHLKKDMMSEEKDDGRKTNEAVATAFLHWVQV